jgi:hypothetical protein
MCHQERKHHSPRNKENSAAKALQITIKCAIKSENTTHQGTKQIQQQKAVQITIY